MEILKAEKEAQRVMITAYMSELQRRRTEASVRQFFRGVGSLIRAATSSDPSPPSLNDEHSDDVIECKFQ